MYFSKLFNTVKRGNFKKNFLDQRLPCTKLLKASLFHFNSMKYVEICKKKTKLSNDFSFFFLESRCMIKMDDINKEFTRNRIADRSEVGETMVVAVFYSD